MGTTVYSGTPLLKKLGVKEGMKLMLINEPDNYFGLLEKDVSGQLCGKNEKPDLIHVFAKSRKEFENEMTKLRWLIKPTTVIWVSWYKKSAGIPTDLSEDIIRHYALENELVDVKVCAVDEWWSGLKLVVPLAKRGQ